MTPFAKARYGLFQTGSSASERRNLNDPITDLKTWGRPTKWRPLFWHYAASQSDAYAAKPQTSTKRKRRELMKGSVRDRV